MRIILGLTLASLCFVYGQAYGAGKKRNADGLVVSYQKQLPEQTYMDMLIAYGPGVSRPQNELSSKKVGHLAYLALCEVLSMQMNRINHYNFDELNPIFQNAFNLSILKYRAELGPNAAAHLPHLSSIRLGCLNDSILKCLTQTLPQLQSLHIYHEKPCCCEFSREKLCQCEFYYEKTCCCESLPAVTLETLRSLHLEFQDPSSLQKRVIEYIDLCPQIETLLIQDKRGETLKEAKPNPRIASEPYWNYFDNMSRLKRLKALKLKGLGIRFFELGSISSMTQLESLSLKSVSFFKEEAKDMDLEAMDLEFNPSSKINPYKDHVKNDISVLSSFSNLKKLSISDCFTGRSPITGQELVAILSHLTHLVSFKLLQFDCSAILSLGPDFFSSLCRLKALESISLFNCFLIDAEVEKLLHLNRLRELRFVNCLGMSLTSLDIIQALEQLEQLKLTGSFEKSAICEHLLTRGVVQQQFADRIDAGLLSVIY